MRLFTAIEIPDVLQLLLARIGRDLVEARWGVDARRQSVSFTRRENLHVTVKFFGEVPEPEVPAICDAVRAVTETARVGPLALNIDGIELFPPRGPIRIIAAKVAGDAEKLVCIETLIEDRCAALGIPREHRPYLPHITLARCKGGLPNSLRNSVHDAARNLAGDGVWVAGSVVLMESRLHSTGPEYLPIACFAL